MAAPDAFFLYVEDGGVPQVVGGVAEFAGRGPPVERVRALLAERLPRLPRLTQRVAPAGFLRARAGFRPPTSTSTGTSSRSTRPPPRPPGAAGRWTTWWRGWPRRRWTATVRCGGSASSGAGPAAGTRP
ncbi:hypothetical protein BJF79_48210 [Actinomadura sp. CNU-125]|nr:hypothetical protein BJF79_48210 [Actinomadura sp. CNU-125]